MPKLHLYRALWHEDLLGVSVRHMLAHYPERLPDVRVILPHRRGALALREALSLEAGERTLLLPRILPLRDLETLFPAPPELPEAMSRWQQRLQMARLVYQFELRSTKLPPSAARVLALADSLMDLHAALLREREAPLAATALPEIEGIGAEHWRRRADFLNILFQHWPDYEAETGRITMAEREIRVIRAQAARLAAEPDGAPIYLIGSTGSLPAMRELMRVVAELPQGHVILPGVGEAMEEDSPPGHPHYYLAKTLAHLNVKSAEMLTLSAGSATPRQQLWQQVMTAERHPLPLEEASRGISIIHAQEEEEEAALIALITREGLTDPAKTTAIITPDTGRMERIRLQLALWGIEVTTPQGQPLSALPFGALLLKIARAIAEEASVTSVLDVVHDPSVTLDAALLAAFRQSCRGVLSPLPLAERIRRLVVPANARDALADTVHHMEQLAHATLPFSRWYEALGALLIAFAPELKEGREAARDLLDELSRHAAPDPIAPLDALEILTMALREPVRLPNPNAHPRVHILSPVEARLQHFDRVILAGFNEGEWTSPPMPDPWLNLAQKAALGLPPPGSETSLLALDVALLGMAPEVFLTRAVRARGRPTTPARFLVRLETLLTELPAPPAPLPWAAWRQALRAVAYMPIPPAMPNPPPAFRPRALEVSKLDYLFSDPYRIYASALLGIAETRPFDQLPDASVFGTIAHKLIKKMLSEARDPDAPGWVEHELRHLEGDARFLLLWLPRLRRILKFVAEETRKRGVAVESEFPLTHQLENHPVTLKGRIDRLEESGQGRYSIHDYKTGAVASPKEMREGKSVQLIAYGLMLQEIRGIWPEELGYWALPRGRHAGDIIPYALGERSTAEHAAALKIALYRMTEEPIPYLARDEESPYAPLSRNGEWD